MPYRSKKPCEYPGCPKLVKSSEKFCSTHSKYNKNNTEVIIVAGPPASGKTTYVVKNMNKKDLVVDMDWLFQALSGLDYYEKPEELLPFVCEARDAVIERLNRSNDVKKAWIIGGYPKASKRKKLAQKLDAEVLLLNGSKEKCLERAKNDDRRNNNKKWEKIINDWFKKYTPCKLDKEINI